jgi:hypothetical protein
MVLGLRDFFGRAPAVRTPAGAHASSSTSSASTNAPRIHRLIGNETLVTALIVPMCLDGSVPTAATDCSPALSAFVFNVAPVGVAAQRLTVPWAQAQCCFSVIANTTMCELSAEVPPFARSSLNTTSVFANGAASDTYVLPTDWATTQLTTPAKLRKLYNVPNNVGTNAANSQAVVSFEEQYWSSADLGLFFEATGTQPVVPTVVGYNDETQPGGEASLDIQWIAGVGQGVPTTTWSFPAGDYILDWAMAVANTTDAPLVTSISYGDTELGYLQKSGYGLCGTLTYGVGVFCWWRVASPSLSFSRSRSFIQVWHTFNAWKWN